MCIFDKPRYQRSTAHEMAVVDWNSVHSPVASEPAHSSLCSLAAECAWQASTRRAHSIRTAGSHWPAMRRS